MIFAKIEYLNLLYFNIYIKKFQSNRFNKIANYKKSFPSKINKELERRRIDAAFISSIRSPKFRCSDIGIVAKREVLSVLVLKNFDYLEDIESQTSNEMAKILKIRGKVVIGDKALKIYFKNEDDFADLAKLWYKKYKLPFVFARFCYNRYDSFYTSLSKNFAKKNIKIPYYILKKEANKVGISFAQAKFYLSKIDYILDKNSKKSLKLFLKLSKKR